MAGEKQAYDAVIDSPIGRLALRLQHGALAAIDFVSARQPLHAARSPEARAVCRALKRFWCDPHASWRLPLGLSGTAFQQRVWRALMRIPAGEVRSYGALARQLRTSARAVGGACRANPVPIVVPCHRVVAHSGLGGFMGATRGRTLDIKSWLLDHERAR